MGYVTFGKKGKKHRCYPSGLGDGLQTVKVWLCLSITYRVLAERYKIYVFLESMSWGRDIRHGIWQQMAEAMETLNLDTAYVMGISQGGMIAQWLAVDFPERVKRLILTVTTAKPTQLKQRTNSSIGKTSVNLEILSISCWILQSTPTCKRVSKVGGCFIMSWESLVILKINNELIFSLYLVWNMIV